MKKYECEDTEDVICPNCGEAHDITDLGGEGLLFGDISTEAECFTCGSKFRIEIWSEPTYCTEPLDGWPEEGE